MKVGVRTLSALILACLLVSPALAQRIAPAPVQARMFMKLLAFYTNLGAEEFSIHVVGAPSIARELQKSVGQKVGNATLKSVTTGKGVSEGAKVVYVGKMSDDITNYTRQNKILSITGNQNFVKQGVTLGLGLKSSKTSILLNVDSSKAEGIVWNPAILRVAEQVK